MQALLSSQFTVTPPHAPPAHPSLLVHALPSLHTIGRSQRRPMRTHRDRGPSVTRTASASAVAPRSTASRAWAWSVHGAGRYAFTDGIASTVYGVFLGDVDGDGDLEAWGPHTRGNNFVHYRISAFDHLGTRLFTTDVLPAENILSLYFGDIDGNGAEEMFAVSFVTPSLKLHVFTATGGEQAGYRGPSPPARSPPRSFTRLDLIHSTATP